MTTRDQRISVVVVLSLAGWWWGAPGAVAAVQSADSAVSPAPPPASPPSPRPAPPLLADGVVQAAETGPMSLGVTRVELRRVVRPAGDGALRLGDVAVVTGPLAQRLAGVEVVSSALGLPEAAPGWARLEAQRVRAAVLAAAGWESDDVVFVGAAVEVRVPRAGGARAEASGPSPAAEVEAEPTELIGVERTEAGTVRGVVARSLAGYLGVAAPDLRVGFDASAEPLLGREVGMLGIEVRPHGVGAEIPVEVTLYDGDRVVRQETVRTRALVLRRVGVVARAVERGREIGPSDVGVEARWVEPGVEPAEPGSIVGRVASSRLAVGSVIEPTELEERVLIRRGDLVVLKMQSGGVSVAVREARALGDAARDGVLTVELPGSRRRVTARAAGPGLAIASGAGMTGAGAVVGVEPNGRGPEGGGR